MITSCSSFSPYAKENKEKSDHYVIIYNEKLNIQSYTFGDVEFAYSTKEFKKLNPKQKPIFNNILVYGKTNSPEYEYYILVNPKNLMEHDYNSRIVEIGGNIYYILVSNSAPNYDIEQLMNGVQILKLHQN